MDSDRESPLETWTAPQCPFTVEYSARALDDIRLAIVDAFYSLPRGGAEIGGLLLGSFAEDRLRIDGYAPMACEHAHGPSFMLSDRDHERLARQLAEARADSAGPQPVGWYHSHTRSEIFLSEADQELHRRYFPEPWHVALVVRPHTLQPARAGFFFREPDGSFRGEASYKEFALMPLPVQQLPAGEAPPAVAPQPDFRRRRSGPEGPVITVTASAPEPPAAAPAIVPPSSPEAEPERQPEPPWEPALPKFLEVAPAASHRGLWVMLSAALVLASGAAAFQTRQMWLPRAAALVGANAAPVATPAPVPVSLGVSALDLDGQLQILWRRETVPQAVDARLEIADGAHPQVIPLDSAHLRAGVFTYARESEKVDVALVVRLPDGRVIREATSFLGALPPFRPSEREEIARKAAGLKSDLDAQMRRAESLEKSLKDARAQLKREQQRRLVNQDPEK
jgi:proteasome lid subunit RPN8/RPN11